MKMICPLATACTVLTLSAAAACGQLTVVSQFPSGGGHVGMGYSAQSDLVWVYDSSGSLLRSYSTAGVAGVTLPRPGASANDADIEVAPVDFMLNNVNVPAGSLLYIDGETGVAEVYAVNPTTGAVIATLVTQYGSSHVVGGGYHPGRGTLFLVQDKVAAATVENRVGEVNVTTGAVLNVFHVTAIRPTFTINYGDLDIANNGNLLIVSSDENTIAEFTPEGGFVAEHALPPGPSGLCGIGVRPGSCDLWVSSTGGTTWRLTMPSGHALCGPTCGNQDFNGDGDFGTDADIEAFFACLGGTCCATCWQGGSDFNGDGDFGTDADIESFFRVLGGGNC